MNINGYGTKKSPFQASRATPAYREKHFQIAFLSQAP
jgi:hypothetical protein